MYRYPYLIANNFKFDVNISSSNADITKFQLLHDGADPGIATTPYVFFKHSQAKIPSFSSFQPQNLRTFVNCNQISYIQTSLKS